MKELSKQVLQRIEQEKITPKSVWVFRLLTLLWWSLTAVAVAFGAVAISLAIFVWQNQSWELLSAPQTNRLEMVLLAMPYSWLLILAGLAWLSYYYFRHVGRAYRQPMVKVLLAVVALNILGGYALFATGWGQRLHDFLVDHSSAYERHFDNRQLVWSRPQDGFLSGRIVAVELPWFYLDDFNQAHWQVVMLPDAAIDEEVVLAAGHRVKVVGSILGANRFAASHVKVWTCGCGGYCAKCKGRCGQGKEKTCH